MFLSVGAKFHECREFVSLLVARYLKGFLVAQLVKICLQCRRPQFDSWFGKISWRGDKLLNPVFLGFPGNSDGEESACSAGDLGLIPGLGRSPRGGHGNPLQDSCQGNPMDRGAR